MRKLIMEYQPLYRNALAFALGVLVFSMPHGRTHAQDCVLPERDCDGGEEHCGALVPFEPKKGAGYDDYPINGETENNQYRSYARRDLIMLVKYAAAVVDCKAKDWQPGNRAPIGLGDMSEKTGATPGTSDPDSKPDHPKGTHVGGKDMDIAYYQMSPADNRLRPVCPYKDGSGKSTRHCTAKPTTLDARRTALFIGSFLTSARTRVVGVDPEIGPVVLAEMRKQCDNGTLPRISCDRALGNTDGKRKLAYQSGHWKINHHHHLHIGLHKTAPDLLTLQDEPLSPDHEDLSEDIDRLNSTSTLGHAHVESED